MVFVRLNLYAGRIYVDILRSMIQFSSLRVLVSLSISYLYVNTGIICFCSFCLHVFLLVYVDDWLADYERLVYVLDDMVPFVVLVKVLLDELFDLRVVDGLCLGVLEHAVDGF